VESLPGTGTTFRLYFPFVEEAPAIGPSVAQVLPHPPRVLLVEDDGLVRRVVAETLRRVGSPVVAVESGREALVAWEGRKEPIELLVTDVVMPEMRGEDVAQTLLERDPKLRVLFITGYVDRALDLTAFRRARILRKPFSSDELVRVMTELLGEDSADSGRQS
jgi:CheY-like chemotaxis protein